MQISPQELIPVKSPENTFIQGHVDDSEDARRSLTISTIAPAFLDWTRYELRRAPNTIQRYREALGWVVRDIGDLPVARLHIGHVLELRRRMDTRGCGEARMASILNSLRSLLKFSRTVLALPVLEGGGAAVPRRDRPTRGELGGSDALEASVPGTCGGPSGDRGTDLRDPFARPFRCEFGAAGGEDHRDNCARPILATEGKFWGCQCNNRRPE